MDLSSVQIRILIFKQKDSVLQNHCPPECNGCALFWIHVTAGVRPSQPSSDLLENQMTWKYLAKN